MKKYLYFFKVGFQVTLAYPAKIVFRFLRHAVYFALSITLWWALLGTTGHLGNLTLSSMITYYLLVGAVDIIYTSAPGRILIRDILSGDLNNYLAKPINYWGYLLPYTLGQQLAASSLSIFVVALVFVLFPTIIALPASPLNIVAFLISCIISFLLSHQFFFIVGILGFWVSEATNLRMGLNQFIGLVGGKWFPLSILPPAVFVIFNLMPFKYLFNFPITVFLGQVQPDEVVKSIGMETIWIALILFAGSYLWKKGIKKYEAYGR